MGLGENCELWRRLDDECYANTHSRVPPYHATACLVLSMVPRSLSQEVGLGTWDVGVRYR